MIKGKTASSFQNLFISALVISLVTSPIYLLSEKFQPGKASFIDVFVIIGLFHFFIAFASAKGPFYSIWFVYEIFESKPTRQYVLAAIVTMCIVFGTAKFVFGVWG